MKNRVIHRKLNRFISRYLASFLLGVILTVVAFILIGRAIDIHIENQDTMLCNSAKVSGNTEYLEKCECFYKTDEIQCLQTPTPEVKGTATDLVVENINRVRAENKLSPVKINAKLIHSATDKACDMRDRNYWSHDTPDGKEPWTFFKHAKYSYQYAGENLANSISEGEVVNRWLNSPKHKEVLLSGNYREVGIGRCGTFIVAHFGSK